MEKPELIEDVERIQDKLLQIIEDGDAVDILAEDYAASLNELMKFELIEIHNEKLQLTDKGRQAKLKGVKDFMAPEPEQKEKIELVDFSTDVKSQAKNRSLLVILFFLMISLLSIATLMTVFGRT